MINKVDAFDLENRIGDRAVHEPRAAANSHAHRSPATLRDELIRNQLIRWDQGDLVQQLEARCAQRALFHLLLPGADAGRHGESLPGARRDRATAVDSQPYRFRVRGRDELNS